MKRGDVHWADLVPRSGSEQQGRRPVIVVSHDGFNQTPGWRSIIVVPISTSSSQGKRGPTVIDLSGGTGGLSDRSNRGVSRRLQSNAWMEGDYRGPDLDLVIAGQAGADRHRTFGRDWRPVRSE